MTKQMVDTISTQNEPLLEMAQERLMLDAFLVKNSNIHARDNHGRNALFWAIKTSHKHNTHLLLNHNIDLMVQPNYHALFHTIVSNNFEIFLLLLEFGENIKPPLGPTMLMILPSSSEKSISFKICVKP
ncbi:MAG: hypothetical protein KU29_03325 [Sulfurovum sp. FS06-10]|nr:MAG: hypothetical protein KU29_03325 [Sulfurovum sp. FS06-10]